MVSSAAVALLPWRHFFAALFLLSALRPPSLKPILRPSLSMLKPECIAPFKQDVSNKERCADLKNDLIFEYKCDIFLT